MSIMETAMALVATYTGVPMIGMPFAFYELGFPTAIILGSAIAILAQISIYLLLRTKDLTPRKYESLYELAYILFGRPAVFVICLTIVLRNFGALIINYMIIGETIKTLTTEALGETVTSESTRASWLTNFATSYTGCVILTGIILAPIYFKRKLEKMKIVSYLLAAFFSILVILVGRELY
mmetsp:Transcript_37185/g.48933  ORF Transcript_37185/g.48933 Transcript_37185/m.48933 type:complete len:181 (-) Transcript_37185:971-1513(-)